MTTPTPPPVKLPPVPKRRTAMQWAATWQPDVRWHGPLVVVLWMIAAGWVPSFWPDVPPPLVAVIALPIGWAGSVLARRAYPEADYGIGMQLHATYLAWAVGVAAGAWMAWLAVDHTTPLQGCGWLLVCALGLGGAFAALHSMAPTRAIRRAEIVAEAQAVNLKSNRQALWQSILHACGLTQLEVFHDVNTRAGYTLHVKAVPAAGDKTVTTVSAVRQAMEAITTRAAVALAEDGIEFRPSWLKLEETDAAHVMRLHVTTLDIQAASLTYPADTEPVSILDGVDIGVFEDGDVISFMLAGIHGSYVGATGSGKGVLGNCLIGGVTRTFDAEVQVAATSKLVPLVFPWLAPWFAGHTDRPVISRVAGESIQAVLELFRDAVIEMRRRNANLGAASKWRPTPDQRARVIILDEAGSAARYKETIRVDGQEMTLSDMIWLIAREGRSALISVHMMSGAALMATWGPRGAEIMRDITLRVCLRTMSHYDGRATLPALSGKIDTTKLRNNTFLFQPSNTDDARVLPGKAYHLEDAMVGPVAIRHTARCAPLAADWRERWDRESMPELAAACEAEGYRWPADSQPIHTANDCETDCETAGETGVRSAKAGPVHGDPHGVKAGGGCEDYGTMTANERASFDELAAAFAREEHPVEPSGLAAGLPDPADTIRRIREASQSAAARSRGSLAPLLEEVAGLIEAPDLPAELAEFMPTARLAAALGRTPKDGDPDGIRRAVEQLGVDLAALDPALRSVQRRMGRDRARGYPMDLLRGVIARHRNAGGETRRAG